jgi:hypothetical protein
VEKLRSFGAFCSKERAEDRRKKASPQFVTMFRFVSLRLVLTARSYATPHCIDVRAHHVGMIRQLAHEQDTRRKHCISSVLVATNENARMRAPTPAQCNSVASVTLL